MLYKYFTLGVENVVHVRLAPKLKYNPFLKCKSCNVTTLPSLHNLSPALVSVFCKGDRKKYFNYLAVDSPLGGTD